MQGKRASLILALACNCASFRSEFTPSESFPEEKSPNVVLLVVELVEERCGVKSELGGKAGSWRRSPPPVHSLPQTLDRLPRICQP